MMTENTMPTLEELVVHTAKINKQVLRQDIASGVSDTTSLLGKTANFSVATANILLDVMSKLATAKTLEDVNAAVELHLPLIKQVQDAIAAGEIISVNGESNEVAIMKGYDANTKVAKVMAAKATA